MKRALRWIGMGVGGLLGLAVLAAAAVYLVSEHKLQGTHEILLETVSVPSDPADIVEGRRLAVIHGCFDGCHGEQVEGSVFFDKPMLARIVAPDLTRAVRHYNDAELAVIIRQGVRPDGRTMMVMPSEAFAGLTDVDLGRIIAFLRSLPASGGPGPSMSLGPVGRFGLAVGKFRTVAELVAQNRPPPDAANEQAAFGRYVARSTCAQCHGAALEGDSFPEFTSPSLRIVAAYSADDFARLMRTGVAVGNRELGFMTRWARDNLSQLTDAEIAALYSYLHALSETPPASH